MLNKIFKFKQKAKTELSNYEVYSFVNYLISLEYKIKFINEISDLINNGVELDRLVIFKNSKNKQINSKSINIDNEKNCKDIKSLGEFDSIMPNQGIYDLNLLYKFFNLGNSFIKQINNEFLRDWSLKNITKVYLKSGFDEAINFTSNIFLKEISNHGHTKWIKAIDNFKNNILNKREIYKKFYYEINNTETLDFKRKKDHIENILGKINDSNFPQLLYFDLDSNTIKNYNFNDFNFRDDIDIKKVSHESPWFIDVLTFSDSQFYLFVSGTLTLLHLSTFIPKNIGDINKAKMDKKENLLKKTQEFLENIEKGGSELSQNIQNIQNIQDVIIRDQLLSIYENLVFEFSREIKKLKFEITISDIKNVE